MRTLGIAIVGALAALLGLVLVPGGAAGAAGPSCVAWASLPARVALAGSQVQVRATLRGTADCQGVTADAGGTATLNGPGGSTSDFPLQWDHLGATDTAPFTASVDALGTYRIGSGSLQTYDAQYFHIPYRWQPTATVVKYAGRFRGVTRAAGLISARLQYFAKYDWAPHAGVLVSLQRHTAGGWQTVGHQRSSGSGLVSLRAGAGEYRLVSATTGMVWSTSAAVGSTQV